MKRDKVNIENMQVKYERTTNELHNVVHTNQISTDLATTITNNNNNSYYYYYYYYYYDQA